MTVIRERFRRGFTLLEVTVVSVIVGVLASTALPSYARAIDRVREVEVISIFSAGCMAQFVHHIEHGRFAQNTSDLLIGLPPMNGWKFPGPVDNPTWTVEGDRVQITATSMGHGHSDAESHQIRGSVNAQGIWLIETKRPGETTFTKLGS